MALMFLGKEHEKAFLQALDKANAKSGGKTVQTVLYLLTAVPTIAEKLDYVFDFRGGYVDPDASKQLNLSRGERILFALAVNLFNGYKVDDAPTNPYEALGQLDTDHKRLYLSALEYRFI